MGQENRASESVIAANRTDWHIYTHYVLIVMNNSILPSYMTHTRTHKIDINIALPNHHSLRSACTYNERIHMYSNVPYSFARGSDFVVNNHFRCQFFSRPDVCCKPYGTLSWHIIRIEVKSMASEKNSRKISFARVFSFIICFHLSAYIVAWIYSLRLTSSLLYCHSTVIFWFVVDVW